MYFISYSIYGLVLVWSLLESQPFSDHLYIYFLDMETTGFSSSRNDVFPAGLRVLVVDDDPTWSKILEKMLKKCLYQVTTCCLAREALELLRERKDGFDIVLSDVNMPDMDGFKLLEHVGLEMDLPVIMMSVDGETSRVMKGVQHGACDYLLKPIRMKELRNIWQHVFRKRIHEVRDIESHECAEEIQILRNGMDQAIDGYLMSGIDLTSGKKRKDTENNHDDRDVNDAASVKKARVVWTFQLHQNFVKAVDQIGFDKVGPKKIMDLMNVPWLTRENVASHLQKYRLYLSRLNKNDLKASYLKNSDFPHGEIAGNFSLQNSVSMQHFDVGNGNYGTSGNKILVQNVEPRVCDGDLTDIISFPMAEAQTGDNFDSEVASSSRIGLNHSLGVLEPEIKHPAYSSTVSTQYSWNGRIPEIQFKQEQKLHLKLENGVNQLKLPSVQNHNPVSSLQSAHSTNSLLNGESDKPAWNNSKSSSVTFQSQCDREVTPTESFSLQSESPTTDFYDYEPLINSSWTMKNNGLDKIFMNDQRSTGGNIILGRRSTFTPFDEDLHSCLLHCAGCPTNIGLLQNKESVEDNDPGLIAEAPSYLHDALRFDYEYPFDPIEYPAIDQGLFIA